MNERLQLLGICIDRGGYRRGGRVAQFIAEWEIAVRKHRGPISAEEMTAYWKESRATTYRRQQEFRELFPELGEHATPQDLMRPLLDRLQAEDELVPEGMGLALP